MPDSNATAKLTLKVIGAESSTQSMKGFQQTVTRSMTASERSVASSFVRMAAQYVGFGAVVQKTISTITKGVEFNKFVENQTLSFSVMLKSMQAARTQMQELYNFAVKSPLTFRETAGSAKQLMAYGFASKELVPTLKNLGEVALATGNKLNDIAYVYGTLRSQGRAYSRDLLQFGMRGIPIYEELATVMGVGVDKIQKMASEGKIGFKEVEQAFINMTSEGGKFFGFFDTYMSGLEGKMSVFEDMFEKFAGSATSGINAALKDMFDSLVAILETDDFKEYIDGLAVSIGKTASVVGELVVGLVNMLPLITKALQVYIGFKVGGGIFKTVKNLPETLLKAAGAVELFTLSLAKSPAIMSSIISAIGLLKGALASLFTFIAASPIGLALMGIAGVAGIGKLISNLATNASATAGRPAALASDDASVRRAELQREFDLWKTLSISAKNSGGTGKQFDVLGIKDLSEKYNLDKKLVTTMAYQNGLVSQMLFDSIQALGDTTENLSDSLINVPLTQAQIQAQFLGGLNNKPYGNYMPLSTDEDQTQALGGRGANDYLASVQAEFDAFELSWGAAYDEDKLKENAKKAMESIDNALAEGKDIPNLFKGSYDEVLMGAKNMYQAVIDNYGKAPKELTTWWEPLIKAAEATVTPIDDIDVATQKAIESARQEAAERINILNENKKYSNDKTSIDKQISEERESYLALERLITAEGEKQKKNATAVKDAGKWWTYNQHIVENTLTDIDDIDLATEQTLDNIRKEYQERRAIANANWDNATSYEERFNATIEWQNALAELLETEKRITSEAEKQKNLYLMQTALQGNPAYFDNMLSGAMKSYQSGGSLNIAKGVGAQLTAQTTQGTQVGSLMSSGAGGVGVLTQVVSAFADMLMSIENVNKVLNPFATVMESAKKFLEPILNNVLQPFVSILETIGEAFGKIFLILAPFAKLVTSIIYIGLYPLLTILELVGSGIAFVYDNVLQPAINAIISGINEFIKMLNKIPGVSLDYVEAMQTSTEMLKSTTEELADNLQDNLGTTIDYLIDKFNEIIDSDISSLQDLYDIGAISAASYEEQLATLNAQRLDAESSVALADQQLSTQEAMLERLTELLELQKKISEEDLSDASITGLLKDAGITTLNDYDVLLDAIKGTPTSGTIGGGVTVNVAVEGNVSTEKELTGAILDALNIAILRGL